MESEVFVKSLNCNLSSLVNINNLPSLVCSLVLVPGNDLSSFFILSSVYIKCLLVSDIDEVFILIVEDLEPLRVGTPDLHVVGFSSILDIP